MTAGDAAGAADGARGVTGAAGGYGMLTPLEVEQIARATRAALRGLLGSLQRSLAEVERRPEPWPAKWTALKLTARRVLEENESQPAISSVIAVETARAMLGEMQRLEREACPGESEQVRWYAIERWLSRRAALRDWTD